MDYLLYRMTKYYIISQILALFSFILSLLAYHRDKKKNIMITMIISNILNLLHYVFLWATSWYVTKILAILRDSVIVKKSTKKSYALLILFIVFYFVVWFLTYENIYSLLPLIAATIYIISIWNWDELLVKKSAFFCYFFWLIYNICIWSVVAVFSTIISIISSYIAIRRHYKKLGNKRIN